MDNYLDSVNKHQVYISRLATGILKDEVYPAINEAYKAVRLVLSQYGDINSINDVNKVNAAINKAISENLTVGFTAATASMSTIAINEASYTAGLLSSAASTLSVPSESKINKYVRESIMSLTSGGRKQSAIWSKFVKGYDGNMASRYNAIITSAFNESLTSGKMQTVGQLTKQFRDLNNNILRHEAESLVRTGVQHYANRANQLMAMDNSDIIEREIPIVTFDSRTSDVCISISAKYPKGWLQGKSPIGYPPYHYNAVVGGEMVKTSVGNKKIEDVAVGDMVITHKGRLKPVTAVMRKPCDTGIARVITFESGLTISVTDEHPLLVDGLGWIRADEVKVGDNLFKNIKKISKLLSWGSVTKGNPNDYPSMFDGDEVFTEVASFSGAMSSSVDFNANLLTLKGKVHNSIFKNKLVSKLVGALRGSAVVNKGLLTLGGVFSMPVSLASHKGAITSATMQRVGFLHSFGMHFSKIVGFFSFSVSPMKLTLPKGFEVSSNRASLTSAHRFNFVNSTPSAHSSVSEGELPFDSSKGFLQSVVMKIKEFGKVFFINKFNHWDSQVVKSISIVEHKGMVYNLEVKDDHTYLINGIVTHNCRTVIGYLLYGQGEFEGTKASKGAGGGKQIAATTPFAKFLRDQPKPFIYETLGKRRAELFLAGKLPLASLTDRYLNPLPLSVLDS